MNKSILKFIAICAIFMLPVVVALSACEYAVRNYISNPYSYKNEYLAKNAPEVRTLILGSSHAYYDIIPEVLGGSTFNLANVSQNYHYDYALLKNYDFRNLKTIILPVSYFSFYDSEMEDSDSDWQYAINYKVYMGIDEHSDLSRYNFEISRFPIFVEKLKALPKEKTLSCDSLGAGNDYQGQSPKESLESSGIATAARHTSPTLIAVDSNIRYLEKIAKYCHSKGIELILITTPAYKSYYAHLNRAQLNETHRIINILAKRYNLKYYDFMWDNRFQEGDFYDADHLNRDGAIKFTKILKKTFASESLGL